jgi:hypothetical protein
MRPYFVPLVVVLTLLESACGDAAWAQQGAPEAAAADADVQTLLQTLSFVSRRNEQYYRSCLPTCDRLRQSADALTQSINPTSARSPLAPL